MGRGPPLAHWEDMVSFPEVGGLSPELAGPPSARKLEREPVESTLREFLSSLGVLSVQRPILRIGVQIL